LKEIFWGESKNTPLGSVFAAASHEGLIAVQIGCGQGDLSQRLASRYRVPLTPSEIQVAPFLRQTEAYLQRARKSFDLHIHWALMSSFQKKALRAVYAIPYGETRTYSQIATQIGAPKAVRAVGRANATNPIPLVVPCHRVVGTDGSLRGYRGGEGLKTKAWLLDLEEHHQG
jgi:O-6-methylguanine DNA methyltransferase